MRTRSRRATASILMAMRVCWSLDRKAVEPCNSTWGGTLHALDHIGGRSRLRRFVAVLRDSWSVHGRFKSLPGTLRHPRGSPVANSLDLPLCGGQSFARRLG